MQNTENEKLITPYSLFMIFLNITAIVFAILTFSVFQPDEKTRSFLIKIDVVLSILLLADFAWRFYQLDRSEWKRFLLPWGIIDFLGCLPASPIFRFFRLARIYQVLRELQAIGIKQIINSFKKQLAESTLWLMITLTIPLVLISGWWIFRVESASCIDGASGAICSFGDGVWWAFVTVTTVGYGDRFPVSNTGRLLAGILMTIGVGFFGILTSYLATIFVRQEDGEMEAELKAVRQELAEIKALLEERAEG